MAKNLEKRILSAASKKLNEGEGLGITWEDAGQAITRNTDPANDYTKGLPKQQLRPMDRPEQSDISGARDPKGKLTFADIDEEDSKDIQDDDVKSKRELEEKDSEDDDKKDKVNEDDDSDNKDDKDKKDDDVNEDMALDPDVSDARDRKDQVKPSQIEEEDASDSKDDKDEKKVNEDVLALFAGEKNLSESFKKKASVIFEAAVRVSTKKALVNETKKIEKKYQTKLTEETKKLSEKVDAHLNYVSDKWLEENKIAIETTLRNQLVEDFMNGLKSLFEDHYIDVPRGKVNVVETLAKRVHELEESLNTHIDQNVTLKEENTVLRKKMIFESVVKASNLSTGQADQLKNLAEEMEFKGGKTYRQNLESIVESFSGKKPSGTLNENIEITSPEYTELNEENDNSADVEEINNILSQDAQWRLK